MNDYLSGEKLFGDDFSPNQIEDWYQSEIEGYANLGSKNIQNYTYWYHELNKLYGFKKLPKLSFNNVLGFGSAWGVEFEPIISRIENLTIIEPSDNLKSLSIGNIKPKYVKPNPDGRIEFESNSFDLITCFGTLHHIPNVSFSLSEIVRVLKPGGFLLLREPIVSMGDWNYKRIGLTKNERGIPVSFFESKFKNLPINIISRKPYFVLTSFFSIKTQRFFKNPLFSYKFYLYFDMVLSFLFKSNIKYHALTKKDRIAPTSVFYVVQKKYNKTS